MKDQEITCFFRFDPLTASSEDALKNYIDSSFTNSDQHYAIINQKDTYLGTVSLKNIDHDQQQAEFAISSRKCTHGTGINLEAVMLLFQIAFYQLNLNRIYLNVLSKNGRAERFYEKAGFKKIPDKHEIVNIHGNAEVLDFFEIYKADFDERYLKNADQHFSDRQE